MSGFDNVAWWLFPETIQNDDPIETSGRLKEMGATHAFVYLGNPIPGENLPLKERQKRIGALIDACVKVDLEVHGCFCSMARSEQPAAWHQHYADGTTADILCPANIKVQDWVMKQLNFFLDEYPLTGITLEDSYVYINNAAYDPANLSEEEYQRMPTCYCDSCKKYAPGEEVERKIYFKNALTSLVSRISKEVKIKRNLPMSAAVRMPYNREFYRPYKKEVTYWDGWGSCQSNEDFKANWVNWYNKDLIDFVCPMSYLRDTRIVELQTMEADSLIENPSQNVWMGLGISTMTAEYHNTKKVEMMNDPPNLRRQLEMLSAKGHRNVVFFAYFKEWVSDEQLKMMSAYFK